MWRLISLPFGLGLFFLAACTGSGRTTVLDTGTADAAGAIDTTGAAETTGPADLPSGVDIPHDPATRLGPENLVYAGAFRLPFVETQPPLTWTWGGRSMTWFAGGDPGSGDTTPGSLFIAGNDYEDGTSVPRSGFVAELAIPDPVVAQGNLDALPVAKMLQDFTDVRGPDLYPEGIYFELPKMGLEVLPGEGDSSILHVAWGQHLENDAAPSACDGPPDASCVASQSWRVLGPGGKLDVHPTVGPWWVDGAGLYSVNDYLFAIPQEWADAHVGGRRLVAGRFRDGGQGSQGPVAVAIAPWQQGSPPPAGALLESTVLLHYTSFPETSGRLNGYQHSDEWVGAAWLAAGSRRALAFVGTKSIGAHYWYGWQRCPGGVVPCMEPESLGGPGCFDADGSECGFGPEHYCSCTDVDCDPDCFGARGWWTEEWQAQVLLYDPADLEAVAAGLAKPFQPQPYATIVIDDRLFGHEAAPDVMGSGKQRRFRIGAAACDAQSGILYVTEMNADPTGEQPIVHAWRVQK